MNNERRPAVRRACISKIFPHRTNSLRITHSLQLPYLPQNFPVAFLNMRFKPFIPLLPFFRLHAAR